MEHAMQADFVWKGMDSALELAMLGGWILSRFQHEIR